MSTRNRERFKAVEVPGDGDKDLEGDRAFQTGFKGRVDRVGVCISILDGFQSSSVLDDGLLCLDAGPDMDHVIVATENRNLTLNGRYIENIKTRGIWHKHFLKSALGGS